MKVFYFTDVHGQLDLFHAMLNWCACQDSEYHLIYGGDAADRGEYGYQIMKELLNNPRVTYLYGNHEDLFVKAADAIIGKYAMSDESYAYLHRRYWDHPQYPYVRIPVSCRVRRFPFGGDRRNSPRLSLSTGFRRVSPEGSVCSCQTVTNRLVSRFGSS